MSTISRDHNLTIFFLLITITLFSSAIFQKNSKPNQNPTKILNLDLAIRNYNINHISPLSSFCGRTLALFNQCFLLSSMYISQKRPLYLLDSIHGIITSFKMYINSISSLGLRVLRICSLLCNTTLSSGQSYFFLNEWSSFRLTYIASIANKIKLEIGKCDRIVSVLTWILSSYAKEVPTIYFWIILFNSHEEKS